MELLNITIWDVDGVRANNIQKRLYDAMKKHHVFGVVNIMSEPPLIGRMNLMNRIPVLEVENFFWHLHPGKAFSEKDCHDFIELMIDRYRV